MMVGAWARVLLQEAPALHDRPDVHGGRESHRRISSVAAHRPPLTVEPARCRPRRPSQRGRRIVAAPRATRGHNTLTVEARYCLGNSTNKKSQPCATRTRHTQKTPSVPSPPKVPTCIDNERWDREEWVWAGWCGRIGPSAVPGNPGQKSMEVPGGLSSSDLDTLFQRHHDQLLRRLEETLARHIDNQKEATESSWSSRSQPITPRLISPSPLSAASQLRLTAGGGRGTSSQSSTPRSRPCARNPKIHPIPSCPSKSHEVPPAGVAHVVHPPGMTLSGVVHPPSMTTQPVQLIPENLPGATPCQSPRAPTTPKSLAHSDGELIKRTQSANSAGGEVAGDAGSHAEQPFTPFVSRSLSGSKEMPSVGIDHRKQTKDMWRLKIRKRVLSKKMPGPGKVFKPAELLTAYTKEAHVSKHSRLAAVVLKDQFDLASSALIIINCIFIAFQLEYVTAEAEVHGIDVRPAWSLPIELFFCAVFTTELVLRIWVHGQHFFHSQDWAWTLFDGVVVLISMLEVAYQWMASGNTTFFRAMRTLRMTRAIRIIRVFRFFRELRMFVCSIFGSFKALIWSAILMLLFWYVWGVVLTTATYEECTLGIEPRHGNCAALKGRFGTLGRSVLSLYMSMAGGVDWGDIYQIMDPISKIYSYMFLGYLFFTVFGVMNIVTGIFVEAAKESAQNDRDILVRSQMRHQEKYINDMIRLFQEIDTDGSGLISKEEFQRHLTDERALAYFEALKLDISDAATLFDLIDVDKSGGIDIEEFLTGCQRLKGESRALDLAVMRTEILLWIGNFWHFAEHVETALGELTEQRCLPQLSSTEPRGEGQ